jgi:hypothetical protein
VDADEESMSEENGGTGVLEFDNSDNEKEEASETDTSLAETQPADHEMIAALFAVVSQEADKENTSEPNGVPGDQDGSSVPSKRKTGPNKAVGPPKRKQKTRPAVASQPMARSVSGSALVSEAPCKDPTEKTLAITGTTIIITTCINYRIILTLQTNSMYKHNEHTHP